MWTGHCKEIWKQPVSYFIGFTQLYLWVVDGELWSFFRKQLPVNYFIGFTQLYLWVVDDELSIFLAKDIYNSI